MQRRYCTKAVLEVLDVLLVLLLLDELPLTVPVPLILPLLQRCESRCCWYSSVAWNTTGAAATAATAAAAAAATASAAVAVCAGAAAGAAAVQRLCCCVPGLSPMQQDAHRGQVLLVSGTWPACHLFGRPACSYLPSHSCCSCAALGQAVTRLGSLPACPYLPARGPP